MEAVSVVQANFQMRISGDCKGDSGSVGLVAFM